MSRVYIISFSLLCTIIISSKENKRSNIALYYKCYGYKLFSKYVNYINFKMTKIYK